MRKPTSPAAEGQSQEIPGVQTQSWEGQVKGLGFRQSAPGLGGLGFRVGTLLKGSWDLITRVINQVTIPIIAYNPN